MAVKVTNERGDTFEYADGSSFTVDSGGHLTVTDGAGYSLGGFAPGKWARVDRDEPKIQRKSSGRSVVVG